MPAEGEGAGRKGEGRNKASAVFLPSLSCCCSERVSTVHLDFHYDLHVRVLHGGFLLVVHTGYRYDNVGWCSCMVDC